jgi:ribonuclease HI
MKLLAVRKALHFIPIGTYAVFETDSQLCVDSLTRYRRRWERNGWCKDDGSEMANAHLLEPISKIFHQRWVCFRKVKGHSTDEWNKRADRLAVQGRDLQAKQVPISVELRSVNGGKEQVYAFERIHISSLANQRTIKSCIRDNL